MVLGFLLWDSVPDRANQELCAEREKKSTLGDTVWESLRGKVTFRD